MNPDTPASNSIFGLAQLLSRQFLDVADQLTFFLRTKSKRRSRIAGSPGTPYTMHVGFGHIGEVVVDDQWQFIDIDAPGGNIGSYHYTYLTRFEVFQCRLPRILALIAMNSLAADARLTQYPDYLVRIMLGTGENEYRLSFHLLQNGNQQLAFLFLLHKVNSLLNGIHRG